MENRQSMVIQKIVHLRVKVMIAAMMNLLKKGSLDQGPKHQEKEMKGLVKTQERGEDVRMQNT